MMGFAVLLFVAAIGLGYWGVSINQDSRHSQDTFATMTPAPDTEVSAPTASVTLDEDATPVVDTRASVVVLARDVPAHHAIVADDLAVERLRIAPPGSFDASASLLGRKVWRDLPQGSVLDEASFDHGGPLARMISPRERALAIQIDEVVGGGGHVQPGDYVDVLLFLRQDNVNTDQTMQVVVPAVRILSVGSQLGLDASGKPVVPVVADAGTQRSARHESARTAVLAIPEEIVTRLALAAQVGTLRLAVRSSAENHLLEYYKAGAPVVEKLNEQLYQFEKLSLRQAQRPQPGLLSLPRSVEIIRGHSVSIDVP